jgi:hypothetical protein
VRVLCGDKVAARWLMPAAMRPSLLSLRPQTACFINHSTEGRHIKNPQDFYTFFIFHSTEGRHIQKSSIFDT